MLGLISQGRALLHSLLSRNTTKRLGAGPEGADAIKAHAFFSEIDWAALEAKQAKHRSHYSIQT